MTTKALSLVALLGLFAIPARADDEHKDMPKPPTEAVAVMIATEGNENVRGTIRFSEKEDHVLVYGEIGGLTPGKHGFHIHEFGDQTDPKGLSAGGHFNPEGHMHGGPDSEEHHAGDLGNIVADEDGLARVNMKAKWLKVHFILGRGLVVHVGADDLKTQPTGDAGGRAAVGVIGVAQPEKK